MIQGDGNGSGALIGAALKAKLGEQFTVGNEKAWLVVDTRRFSQYSITDLEMEHIYGTGSRVNPTVPSNTMKMKLIDTTGLTFFNFMMDLMRNKLKSTRASAFFLLSIVFVGHRDDGTTETISTCHIPLTLLLMSFEFTSSGSLFDIEFMELEGAPQRGAALEHINSLGSIATISTQGKANTIGDMLDVLEDRLNVQSLEFFQKFQNDQMQKGGGKLKLGKLVQYMITIPDEWRQFPVTNATRSRNVEMMHKTTKPAGKDKEDTKKEVSVKQIESDSRYSQLTFSNSMTITDAIKAILESSKEFTDLQSKEKRLAGNAVSFKTITTITSDEATYVVHFDIYPYYIPKVDEKGSALQAGSTGNTVGASKVKNLITYDYIFTGGNSHIKNLKIQYNPESAIALDTNLELGSSRFAYVASDGQKEKKTKSVAVGANKSDTDLPQIRPGDPIFFAMKTVDQKKNNVAQRTEELEKEEDKKVFKSKQEYTQTMATLHFLSSIVLDVEIRGNPNIIRKFADRSTRYGVAPHYQIVSVDSVNAFDPQTQDTGNNNFFNSLKNGVSSAKAKYIADFVKPRIDSYRKGGKGGDDLLNGIDVSILPVFVKINILAPNVDWTGEFNDANNLFTNEFFFKGPYQLLFVKTTFHNGSFDHLMTMIPYDVAGSYSTSSDGRSLPQTKSING
jgi:hypothetical protein